jgi:hypothetical protein
MGYTHYFHGLTATPAVIADARKIIDASRATVCGPLGQGLPVLGEADGIWLNGFEAADEDFETFHLRGTDEPEHPDLSAFCKTAHKPYDVVVTAILISAAVRSMEDSQVDDIQGSVRSDGKWDNWVAGVELFEQAVRPLTMDEKIALELDVENMRALQRETPGVR